MLRLCQHRRRSHGQSRRGIWDGGHIMSGTLTSLGVALQRQAQGFAVPMYMKASGLTPTAATVTCGGFSGTVYEHGAATLFTTNYGLEVGIPPGLGTVRPVYAMAGLNTTQLVEIGRFYQLGTLVCTSTGNQFTHDAATFPMTRTVMGQSAQPITLIPMVLVTT